MRTAGGCDYSRESSQFWLIDHLAIEHVDEVLLPNLKNELDAGGVGELITFTCIYGRARIRRLPYSTALSVLYFRCYCTIWWVPAVFDNRLQSNIDCRSDPDTPDIYSKAR